MVIPRIQEHHHNFCFSVPERLESERVLLEPFVPSKHANAFIAQARRSPELFNQLVYGPFRDGDHFIADFMEKRIQDSGILLFAIFDKTKTANNDTKRTSSTGAQGTLAGIIALVDSSVAYLKTEIGPIIILPEFQRTHVSSNAVGLLLHYALDLPGDTDNTSKFKTPGLGLRRVSWKANSHNQASIGLAKKMGFRVEGIVRWDGVFPPDREALGVGNGRAIRAGDSKQNCVGRDTVLLGLCWDDWEEGNREQVDMLMARKT